MQNTPARFGATTPAVLEALDILEQAGERPDALRIKAFPFGEEIKAFAEAHDTVFVIEQNRDAQMRSLLINEADIVPAKLVPLLNYDGMPLTAAFVVDRVSAHLSQSQVAAE